MKEYHKCGDVEYAFRRRRQHTMPNCLRWTAKIAAHMAIERGSQPLAGWIFGEARETPRAWPGIMNAMHGRALGAISRAAFFKIGWKCSCRRALGRLEERWVGKEWVSKCMIEW